VTTFQAGETLSNRCHVHWGIDFHAPQPSKENKQRVCLLEASSQLSGVRVGWGDQIQSLWTPALRRHLYVWEHAMIRNGRYVEDRKFDYFYGQSFPVYQHEMGARFEVRDDWGLSSGHHARHARLWSKCGDANRDLYS
jgi:hypothetical protein